jgi:ATP-dependent DNA helicase PIF1
VPSQKRSYSLSPPPPTAKKARSDFVDLTGHESEGVAQNVPAEYASESVVLCKEQKVLVELARNGCNIFYTGAAGTGKSVTLKAIVASLQADGKRVHVVASTGRAALNVGGTTTYAYLGIDLTVNTRDMSYSEGIARDKGQRFQDTDVLIIDEVSMIENNHFERIDRILKAGRESNLPF